MASKYSVSLGVENIDVNKWIDFVETHNHGNIFQSFQMYKVYEKTPNHSPLLLVVYDNLQEKIVGSMLAYTITSVNGILAFLTARSIVIGGPLVAESQLEVTKILLSQYDKLIRKRVIYSQFRNLSNILYLNDAFQDHKYKFKSHLNFIINLEISEDKLWAQIGKGRRKQIQKAIKNNLYVTILLSSEINIHDIDVGYDIIRDVYKRAGLPLASKELLINAWKQMELILFFVKKDNEILGCRFALGYMNCLYGWFAGSYEQYYSLYPNDILIWETLLWGTRNHYKYFDYGGAGDPNKPYGVRKFKSQIGGELVNFGRYEKIHNSFLMQIGEIGIRFYKMLGK